MAFVSAMTLTQRADGEPGASYLEFIDLLQFKGSNTHRDRLELFRRVVFSIPTHNTDDHLRNHGFLIGERSITLSPAYDINPSADGKKLSLAINELDTYGDVSVAMNAHSSYGLSKIEAEAVVTKTRSAVALWRAEQDLMERAFGHS